MPEEHYDFVCSVAAIHHMDFTKGLSAMRDALRPGGGPRGHQPRRQQGAAGLGVLGNGPPGPPRPPPPEPAPLPRRTGSADRRSRHDLGRGAGRGAARPARRRLP
ncbi:class I SAM-dependent methyltransferase [Actinomadura madurae]|uniref:class I SAM-dependent methyltransferase n=1 Tax=Actinomadura madurae TaxID=1993 RepID=UPI00355612C1